MKNKSKTSTRVRNPEQTRLQLLEAAFDEIHLNGFQAASVDHILKSTNVTKGAFYHHFGNKMSMGYAVLEEVLRPQIIESWVNRLQAAENPIDEILTILKEKSEECDENMIKCGCPLNNLVQEMSPIDDGFRLRLQQILDLFVQSISHALEKGKVNGSVNSEIDAESAAYFILSAIQGMTGIMKNSHSFERVNKCVTGLISYLNSLRA